MNIAIDVMGGDYAPEAVIDGIIQAIPSLTNKEVILAIGPKEIIDHTISQLQQKK
jgi:glycerol-3-phosphate acyltransferase PlsX